MSLVGKKKKNKIKSWDVVMVAKEERIDSRKGQRCHEQPSRAADEHTDRRGDYDNDYNHHEV